MTVAHNLHEHPQQFEDVREKVESLKPQLDRLKQIITATTIDGDPEETSRRVELARYVRRSLTTFALVNGLCSALGEILRESQELLAKDPVVQFMDKDADPGKVARLIERLRKAISNYQVSGNYSVAPSAPHRKTGAGHDYHDYFPEQQLPDPGRRHFPS